MAAAILVFAATLGCSKTASVSSGTGATAGSGTASTAPGAASGTDSATTFSTLSPGSALPSDASCATRVRPAPEVRPHNAQFNATRGTQKKLAGPYPLFSRVDGNFTGTTDEIIQWTACKWGVDENIVRAQAVVESWWHQTTVGDWSTDAKVCAPNHPIGSDHSRPGQCPESVGLLQARYQYWSIGFNEVETSTAYNSDFVYAAWRSCYEGQETWLNRADKVGTYAAGDAWGCLGVWFSGRWHTSAADGYIGKVRDAYQHRTWTQASFLRG